MWPSFLAPSTYNLLHLCLNALPTPSVHSLLCRFFSLNRILVQMSIYLKETSQTGMDILAAIIPQEQRSASLTADIR